MICQSFQRNYNHKNCVILFKVINLHFLLATQSCLTTTGARSHKVATVSAQEEQYYNFMKAKYFKDDVCAAYKLGTDTPVAALNLGKRINNFRTQEWEQVCVTYMIQGLEVKFRQNDELSKALKETEQMMLIDANPFDYYWGIGISLFDNSLWDENKWKGQNMLGKLLMKLRESL